ncbi:SPOR domain-containing protein [Alloacidobacterium sp.]|uniref:SPOR domain-containing protein n=1 Tax=Alloacidobacterium sp. TaxID=2951999 RepID=UPI002D2228BD|nr:SPOR domain-containing protein [Alloacidobacterium sp.]HYK37634.1 SPOR domain-containing protein [Alloacidobacterium sp.]
MKTATEHLVENDSEITLSATTLLGIFFGLVLVCGVFFGFGYSTGRRGEAPSANVPPTSASDSTSALATSHTPKPSAMESLQPANSSTPDPNAITESLDEDSTPDNAPSQTSAPAVKPTALTPAPAAKPVAALPASVPPSTMNATPMASRGGSVMVQIAAVTRPEDANALATALRQRGYNVVVRNESQDKLLHVQVGPFASRDDAAAMRSKLLADGYNAILK